MPETHAGLHQALLPVRMLLPCTRDLGIHVDLCYVQLLVKHPKERMELHNVLQHPWIVGNANPAVLR